MIQLVPTVISHMNKHIRDTKLMKDATLKHQRKLSLLSEISKHNRMQIRD